MKDKARIREMSEAFFVSTTCICILQGILGVTMYPKAQLSYDAFFVPPMFGLISVFLGIVTWSREEQTVKQVLLRRMLHLILIEIMVFGLNYLVGNRFSLAEGGLLAGGIAIVFVSVYVITWLNDRKNAKVFNVELKKFQAKAND